MARRILGRAWWASFTFNGITRYGNGADSLIGGDELRDNERNELLQLCRQRLDQSPGAHPHQRALEVDQIVPKNHGGTGDLSNLQALCFRCNAGKREAGCVFCAGAHHRADGVASERTAIRS